MFQPLFLRPFIPLQARRHPIKTLYRKSIGIVPFAGLIVGPTMLSAKLQTSLLAQHSSLQKEQAVFPANIRLCKRYKPFSGPTFAPVKVAGLFVRPTFASAKLQTPLSAQHSSLQKEQALLRPNIALCKSYKPFYRPTFGSANVTCGFVGPTLRAVFGQNDQNDRDRIILKKSFHLTPSRWQLQ
jgi:hypothetical protein